jgi:hypothetical protein
MHTPMRPDTHTHTNTHAGTCAHTHRQICNTYCFSTATMIRESASVLRYTYIACLVKHSKYVRMCVCVRVCVYIYTHTTKLYIRKICETERLQILTSYFITYSHPNLYTNIYTFKINMWALHQDKRSD